MSYYLLSVNCKLGISAVCREIHISELKQWRYHYGIIDLTRGI